VNRKSKEEKPKEQIYAAIEGGTSDKEIMQNYAITKRQLAAYKKWVTMWSNQDRPEKDQEKREISLEDKLVINNLLRKGYNSSEISQAVKNLYDVIIPHHK